MQQLLTIFTSTMIITIGRQLAAGGRAVGKMLAERLSLRYYDSALLALAAKESGLSEEAFSAADEQYNIFTLALSSDNQRLFRIQSDVIGKVAADGDCVFVGRAADYVLRQRQDVLSVFLTADTGDRIDRLMKDRQITEKEALTLIEKADRRRADYYNFYTGKEWGRACSYHLCINTSQIPIESAVELICQAIIKKETEKH